MNKLRGAKMVNVNKIKTLAKQKGIKQGYLCDQLGKHFSYLNDIEKGKTSMSVDSVEKVAKLLDTSVEYLTDITDDPSPKKKEPVEALDEVDAEVLAILRGMSVEDKLELLEYLKGKM